MLKYNKFKFNIFTRTLNNQITSRKARNHYETLKLPKDCSSKEIRESFLKLSKQYHPDVNKNLNTHNQFQEIIEAYKVLGKDESRRNYDLELQDVHRSYRNHNVHNPWGGVFYGNRSGNEAYYNPKPFYGIKGINKVSNGTIVFLCLCFTSFGFILQMMAITKSVTFQRDELKRKSDESLEELRKVNEEAEANGNKVQMEKLKEKLLRER